jgi:hypothetical protein
MSESEKQQLIIDANAIIDKMEAIIYKWFPLVV